LYTKQSSLFSELLDLAFFFLRRFYLIQKLPLTVGYRLVVQFFFIIQSSDNLQ